MYKRYVVRLTDEERGRIGMLLRRGRVHARSLLYARILLKADASGAGPAWTDERIAEPMVVEGATYAKVFGAYMEHFLAPTLKKGRWLCSMGKGRGRMVHPRRLRATGSVFMRAAVSLSAGALRIS